MGNTRSEFFEEETDDLWWPKNEAKCEVNKESTICEAGASAYTAKFSSGSDVDDASTSRSSSVAKRKLSPENKEKLDSLKLELTRKQEQRRQIIADKHKEMDELRAEVARLTEENNLLRLHQCHNNSRSNHQIDSAQLEQLRRENDDLKELLQAKSRLLENSEELIHKNRELRISIAEMQQEIQDLNADVLSFEKEREEYNTHVRALKDVISVSKNMLEIREAQLKELKEKVQTIEQSLAEREMNILSQDLRHEYERQLANIRSLRTLYQERSRIEKVEREQLASQVEEFKKNVEEEQAKNRELQERIQELDKSNSKKYDEIKALESNLGLAKAEGRQYQAELAVINQLFSQILLGFNNSHNIDLDKLRENLEEHHDLLQEIVSNEISSEVSSALPKVLLDLLTDVHQDEQIKELGASQALETITEETEAQVVTASSRMNSAEEIVENLPKVWKVLIELLSHQTAPVNELTDNDSEANPCYKTVETAKGPSLVLSVSQTYIRLKDLILEKKSLEKETNHLKQLNGHLENRLQDQEKRLEQVHSELSKTWHVVGKLQKQHQMLHTQEKILRYELAQKRKLLSELKEELEYSREKWAQAREKNSSTEKQWRELRTEFAARRKPMTFNDDINNSVESGYSDDRECSSDDEEPGYETDVSECAPRHNDEEICDNIEIPNETRNGNQIIDVTSQIIPEPSDLLDNLDSNLQIEHDHEQVQEITVSNEASAVDLNEQIEDRLSASSNEPVIINQATRTLEEVLAQRDERLRRLEGQTGDLVNQVTNTANRSVAISNRLDDLHEAYGGSGTSEHNQEPAAESEDITTGTAEEPNQAVDDGCNAR